MRYLMAIVLSLGVCVLINAGMTRNYNHKEPALNAEFDAIYNTIQNNNFFKLRTSAELVTIVPSRVGEYYFNTDTNEIWISTGTGINDFIHK